MYPNSMKLTSMPDEGALLTIDGDTNIGLSITTEIESCAGSGALEITLEAQGRGVRVMLSPDDALTLADALTFYANASKRIAEKHPQKPSTTTADGMLAALQKSNSANAKTLEYWAQAREDMESLGIAT